MNASEYLEYLLPYYSEIQLASEKDVLGMTAPQDDKALIYSLQHGYWEHSILLNESITGAAFSNKVLN